MKFQFNNLEKFDLSKEVLNFAAYVRCGYQKLFLNLFSFHGTYYLILRMVYFIPVSMQR